MMNLLVTNNDHNFAKDWRFKYIELDDTKSIAKYSYIFQPSVAYLDLNIGDYNSPCKSDYEILDRRQAQCYKTFAQTTVDVSKYLGQYSRMVSSLDLDMKHTIPIMQKDYRPFRHRKTDRCWYKARVKFARSWYEKVLQKFLAQFIKQSKEKLTCLKKFFRFASEGYFCAYTDSLVVYCMGMMCFECYDAAKTKKKGVVIAMSIPNYDSDHDSPDVSEYFIYHTCIATGESLPMTADLGKDIVRLALRLGYFRYVPHLIKCGFSSLSGVPEIEVPDKDVKINRRRNRLFTDISLLHSLHRIKHQDYENVGPWMSGTANNALAVMWRSIPDAFLSKKEIAFVYGDPSSKLSAEEFLRVYEEIVGDCPDVPTPRPLLHLSRVAIRNALFLNNQLPHGISELPLPKDLRSYLNLEY